jgi:tRNA G46 methylase TrmB
MLNHNKSIEQEKIIEEVGKGSNIMVDAVAGSGKSTTILLIANAYPNKKFLQITYNSMLRYEVKEKVKKIEITNITSFSSWRFRSSNISVKLLHIENHPINCIIQCVVLLI